MFNPGNIGMFPMIIPKPMGISSRGSHPFFMAIVMNRMPMKIMAKFCHVALANPVKYQNCRRLSKIVFILGYLDYFGSFQD